MTFSTPIGLLKEKGAIGIKLRQLPPRVLDEAENKDCPWSWLAKWVKCNPIEFLRIIPTKMAIEECARLEKGGFKRAAIGLYLAGKRDRDKSMFREGVHEVQFCSHNHDPNKICMRILMSERWPDSFRKTFEAVASQRKALLRLTAIARGGGSIYGTKLLKLRAARQRGDQKMIDYWSKKEAASILQTERGRKWLLSGELKPWSEPLKIRKEARRMYDIFYAADVRRLGRQKAVEKWKSKKPLRFKLETNSDFVAVAMTTEWLVAGQNGFPGLCFMSDELIAELLGLHLPWPKLLGVKGWKTIRTIRERIGLKKGEIIFNKMEKIGDRKFAMLNRHGRKTHWITIRPNKKFPPEL